MCNIPSRANLYTGYSSCWVLEISYYIPSTTVKVMGAHEGEHLSNILVYAFEHIYNKARRDLCDQGFFFSRPGLVSWIKVVVKHHSS